ncbi:hypothetical protein ACLOJK_040322 [Asimina triloba]
MFHHLALSVGNTLAKSLIPISPLSFFEITMGPKKVTRASFSSDTEQLTQLLEHKKESSTKYLLEDSSPPLAFDVNTSCPYSHGIGSHPLIIGFPLTTVTPTIYVVSVVTISLATPFTTPQLQLFILSTTIPIFDKAHFHVSSACPGAIPMVKTQQTWGTPPYVCLNDPIPSGIRNYELTRELDLRPPRSVYEMNEIIFRHISIEETKKQRNFGDSKA